MLHFNSSYEFDFRPDEGNRMTCKDAIHLICWYLEGKLSPGVAKEIEHHIKQCPDCHMVLAAAVSVLDQYFGDDRGATANGQVKAA